jgi:predicted phosphodiesterase
MESDTLGHNKSNFDVISKRFQKYADKIKERLGKSVTNITVAFMGDLINSDRRIDELLVNEGCVAESLLKSLQILTAFLLDLSETYKINVVSVLGNESRLDLNIPMRDPINNFDFIIHKLLSELLNKTSIQFQDIERNYEKVIEVLGANILLTHGHTKLTWNDAVKKYNKIGKILHYMLTAHFHTVKIKEQTSQGASMSGNNFYGAFGINDIADASQTIYIVEKEKDAVTSYTTISPMVINLQRLYGYSGYFCQEDVCKMR